MQIDEMKLIVEQALPEAEVKVKGDGRHFQLQVISDVFADKKTLERQKIIYRILRDHFASGDVHALTMRTWTPTEWKKKHG